MITLWGRPDSINVQKVLWTLAELDREHRHVDAGGDAGGLDEPWFRAMNPHGRVPVIEDQGVRVWESNAIVRYLCAAYSPGVLSPTAPLERALCDQWMDWTATALQPAIMGLFWGFYRTPAARRDLAANARLEHDCRELVLRLDSWLARRAFVAGVAFSMADIPAGALMHRYFGMGIDPPDAPAVRAWCARLVQRLPYRSAVMRPFAGLFARRAY